jgi:hypothetical protein
MKTLRIVATVIVGGYFLAMALQLTGISIGLLEKGVSPYAAEASVAFFPNLLVCTLSALALWAIWKPWSKNGKKA